MALLAGAFVAAALLAWRTGGRVAADRLGELARRPRAAATERSQSPAVVAITGSVLLAAAAGPSPLALLPWLVPLGAAAVRRQSRRVAARARCDAVVDVVFALAAELRAGQPAAAALSAVAAQAGPLSDPLARAAAAVRGGATATGELARIGELDGCASLRPVAYVWDVTERTGGAVADVLDRLGDALEADDRNRLALDAALAGPRTTMVLLACLPGLGLLLGQSTGAHPLHLLLHTRVGWGLSLAAAAFDAVGLVWASRISRAVAAP